MQPVRWGILNKAKIGRTKGVPGMMKNPLCQVVAVASRNEEAAREMPAELGIVKGYGSYEALLSDPDIEAVYNPFAQPSACADDAGRRSRRQSRAMLETYCHHGRRGGGAEASSSPGDHC